MNKESLQKFWSSTKDVASKGMIHPKKIYNFVKDVANDERVPDRDKAVLLGLLALLVSPFDIIPDWIPIFGVMDDIVIAAVILDYFFDVLDQDILLSHWPYELKGFNRLKSVARLISSMTPKMIKEKIWEFKPDPLKK